MNSELIEFTKNLGYSGLYDLIIKGVPGILNKWQSKNIKTILEEQFDRESYTNNENSYSAIDDDWFAYWCNHAKNVSDEDMRIIWGRILKGEMEFPDRFSKQTLAFVAALGKAEAVMFENLCKFKIQHTQTSFMPLILDEMYNDQGYLISYMRDQGEEGMGIHFKLPDIYIENDVTKQFSVLKLRFRSP